MIRKPAVEKKQEKVNDYQLDSLTSPKPNPARKNRITLTSVLSKLPKVDKKDPQKEKVVSEITPNRTSEGNFEEKDRMIKQLQEEIIHKKLKNDMIQQAFRRRQQSADVSDKEELCSWFIEKLVNCCVKMSVTHKSFKRAVLKVISGAMRVQKRSRMRAAKVLLVWLVGWINHLFSFLSYALAKK